MPIFFFFNDFKTKMNCMHVFSMCFFNMCLPFNYFCIELRMFPDKFVVCISKLEFNPSAWTCESGALVCTKLYCNFSGLFYSGKMNVYV